MEQNLFFATIVLIRETCVETTTTEEEVRAQIREDQNIMQKEDLGAKVLILERILEIITVLQLFSAY